MALIGYSVLSFLFPVFWSMIVWVRIFLLQKAIASSNISDNVPSILLLSRKRTPSFVVSPISVPGMTVAVIANYGSNPCGYIPKFNTEARVGTPFRVIDNNS